MLLRRLVVEVVEQASSVDESNAVDRTAFAKDNTPHRRRVAENQLVER